MDFLHVPVLLNECIENLHIKPDGVYMDGTFGGGGHSGEIYKRLGPKGLLIAVDRDQAAIDRGRELYKEHQNVIFFHRNYGEIKEIISQLPVTGFDGILLDLGVSSYQLDEPARGFSYMYDAPLDMRMDQRQRLSAYEIINNYDENKLAEIFFNYGEERYAKRIAQAIAAQRKSTPVQTTLELVEIIKKALPGKALREKQHPAKRCFQAVRIEVNSELDGLKQCIIDMVALLNDKGRLAIITFHSLEDRIVKHIFRKLENPCECPPDFPVCVCGKKSQGTVINRKPIIPDDTETEKNHRARSAKLRVFEKNGNPQ